MRLVLSRGYLLSKDSITPLCDIELPNQLPMKRIEDKMGHMDLVRSSYSYGLDDIFISGNIVHFTFSKDGFIHSCYYDLGLDKILFCGPRVLADTRKNLPFYSLIRGVFDGKFYSILSPLNILERKENHPEFFHEDLKDIDSEDNYVIAFYKIV